MRRLLRWVYTGILFLLLGLLEYCFGPIWMGCNPPYLVCAIVVCSMFFDEKSAAIFGLCAGLFADASSWGLFGLKAAFYMVLAYLIAFLTEKILSRNVITSTVVGFGCVFLSELLSYWLHSLSQEVSFLTALRFVFFPRLVMCVPVLLLLYLFFFFLFRDRETRPGRR